MILIVKPEVLEKSNSAKELAGINLDEKENQLPINKIELGFGAHGLLSTLEKRDVNVVDKTKKSRTAFKKIFDEFV